MMVVSLLLWVRALSAVRRPSRQNSTALNACVLIILGVLFAIFLLPIDLASRTVYFFFFSPVQFFIFLVLGLFLEPATLLITRLLHRVNRGIPEKSTERQQPERPTTKSTANPLQWIRR
jgi:dolichyl-phosphate-mannose--protein O-mannosyl transferase